MYAAAIGFIVWDEKAYSISNKPLFIARKVKGYHLAINIIVAITFLSVATSSTDECFYSSNILNEDVQIRLPFFIQEV